ncbi:MAG: YqeG family HAD IIIA-type phosphatase [Clostridia bacterium]|nr:YqeG family HAD IIIA-type phosphatase [Clostridia bacterium]
MSLFIPELYKQTVYDIPQSFFTERGIKLLFMDIDNTLVTYDDELPTPQNTEWFKSLSQNGIDVVFVSNNHVPRVEKYARSAGYEFFADAHKPFCHVHKQIMKMRGLAPSQCAGVGDQIFTDVLAAHLAGCVAVTVFPIKDVTTAFNRFKRMCERPFMKKYFKLHGGK